LAPSQPTDPPFPLPPQKTSRTSLHVKTQLLEKLYQKSLRVSGAVKAAMGVGPIVNLQSNDAAKLWGLPSYVHIVWNGPMQVSGLGVLPGQSLRLMVVQPVSL